MSICLERVNKHPWKQVRIAFWVERECRKRLWAGVHSWCSCVSARLPSQDFVTSFSGLSVCVSLRDNVVNWKEPKGRSRMISNAVPVVCLFVFVFNIVVPSNLLWLRFLITHYLHFMVITSGCVVHWRFMSTAQNSANQKKCWTK